MLQEFAHAGFPLTKAQVRVMAYEYVEKNSIKGFSQRTKMAGRKWLKNFLQRHPIVRAKKAKNLSTGRAQKSNPIIIHDWFDRYTDFLNELGVDSPYQIWNGDETGLQNVPKEREVVGVTGHQAYQQVSAEQGELSTTLVFVNAVGEYIPPMVIHKGKRINQDWYEDKPREVMLRVSPTGYIKKDLFWHYGVRFTLWLNQKGRLNKPQVLLLDSHSSHTYNYDFMSMMKQHGIHVFAMPPHTSHILQPLDSTPFGRFKQIWQRNLLKFNFKNTAQVLSKKDYWKVYWPTFTEAMTVSYIQSGFRETGIFPPNRNAIPKEKLLPSIVTDSKLQSGFIFSCLIGLASSVQFLHLLQ